MAPPALIDTHVLIWLTGVGGPSSLLEDPIASGDVEVVVSAVSAFEISLEVRPGELDGARSLVDSWPAG